MKRSLLFPIIALFALSAFAWGQKGHDTTAAIAERHLTPRTKSAIDTILDSRSIIYWANWLDNASHTPDYAYTKTWHYKNIDKDVRYEEAPANPAGDIVTAIKAQMELLPDSAVAATDRQLSLKILVHLLGDLHQPMHLGHATDLGGNRIKVKFFGRDNNLHAVWDGSIPESGHKWSYTEWADQLDRVSPAMQEEMIKGSVDDWAKQTLAIATQIYETISPESNISYNEVAYWTPTVEQQFLLGGLRLAHILNLLFDEEYAASHEWPYAPAR